MENLTELEPEPVSALIERLPKYFTMSFASKRNSGKTYLVTDIVKTLLKKKKVDMVLVMSNSAGLNNDYAFLPEGLVMPFKESVLEQLWKRQKNTPREKREHILVVLDDVLSDPQAVRSHNVGRLYALGRHNFISCIVISQVANHVLSPVMKQNSDFILWSRLNKNQLGILWESMNGVEKRDFVRWAETFGGVHFNFCVFDNYTDAVRPEDFLMVIRSSRQKPEEFLS
jgi:hypothetical protein